MEEQNQNKSSKTIQWIAIAIIVASLLISSTILYANRSNSGQQKQQQQTESAADISKVKIENEPFAGNPNAPVVVAYWFDYQCPFCKRFEEDAIKNIINDYVKTGKVKIVFKDYQFLGPDSVTAGLAERAIWEIAPDKFYEWHKAMYEKQDAENSGWGNKANILALAKSLGVDSAEVDQMMTVKSSEYQKIMDANKAEGQLFGINGTPGAIIGKNLISGAQPYSAVKQLIDLALQGK